jgi:lipopolysaccharide/colanic/teichoic acid biosynthesis glycosyltransferase
MDRFFNILFSGIALLLLSPLLVPIFIMLSSLARVMCSFYRNGSVRAVRNSSYLSSRLC